ncbi:MAG: multiheme c-type cytochrome [Sedimentisphaerales bacterium]
MKVKYCLFMLLLGTVVVLVTTCRQQAEEEPLLLLEDGDTIGEYDQPDGPVADNSRCHVCHINYEDEELAVVHARANIGCERCHGSSDAHCNDEDNITPPDIMYPAERINSSCKGCHPTAKLGHGKKYCTDCHGDHRLSYRTRRWDKTTGELIADDKVRMLTDEMLEQ